MTAEPSDTRQVTVDWQGSLMYRFNEHITTTGERCPLSGAAVSDTIAKSPVDSGRCWDNCPDSSIELAAPHRGGERGGELAPPRLVR